jgi:hypothetical protein
LGVIASLGLFFSRHDRLVPRVLLAGGVTLSLLAIGALIPTGYYGGQIRHSEIRAAGEVPRGTPVEDRPGQ